MFYFLADREIFDAIQEVKDDFDAEWEFLAYFKVYF